MKKPKEVIECPEMVIRSITMPVAAPVSFLPKTKKTKKDEKPKPVDLNWKELGKILHPAFRLATDLSNWAVHHMFRKDRSGTTCPKTLRNRSEENPTGLYLYGNAVREFPQWVKRCNLVTASAQAILRHVQSKYMEDRFDFMVRHESSLLTYRYPQPFPVHNQDWSVEMVSRMKKAMTEDRQDQVNNQAPIFNCNLPGHSAVTLRLRQGQEFHRHLAVLRQIATGDRLLEEGLITAKTPDPDVLRFYDAVKRGEALLLRNRKGELLVKMSYTMPVKVRVDDERTNACLLTTQPDALLCAEINGRRISITNGDDLKRAMRVVVTENERHKRFLQRAREDNKYEVRMDPNKAKNFALRIEERCGRQMDRMQTAIKQIAAQTANYVDRQRVGFVLYNDAKRQFIEDIQVGDTNLSFPWYMLAQEIKDRLLALGIVCVFPVGPSASVAQQQEYEQWVSNPTVMWQTSLCGKRLTAHENRKSRSHPEVCAPSGT